MFGLGTPELIVILAIAFLFFGGKRLPEIGSGLGRAITSFKKGLKEVEETGLDVKQSLPGTSRVEEVKDKVDKAKALTRMTAK